MFKYDSGRVGSIYYFVSFLSNFLCLITLENVSVFYSSRQYKTNGNDFTINHPDNTTGCGDIQNKACQGTLITHHSLDFPFGYVFVAFVYPLVGGFLSSYLMLSFDCWQWTHLLWSS